MLVSKGYEVFLPLRVYTSFWKNRQKRQISQPIFPSYIFVRTDPSQIYYIENNPKIVRCVTCGSTPSTINSEEISVIQRMLNSKHPLVLENDIPTGKRVKIVYGPFEGVEGILIFKKGKHRFGIQIDNIPHILSIEVNVDCIQTLN